ncbi:2-hydroxyacyl-CoA dehydratase family protein, partial [Myxococcota bacterium]|nr:2-hydroxyacyl-CoA dehydratase family protein [Myxococcota bacterium]
GCDHNRRLFDNWRFADLKTGFHRMLFVPYSSSEPSLVQFRNELDRLKTFLESTFDTTITRKKLLESIGLYNKKRALLREIAQTRLTENPPISGAEFMSLMHAVVTIPVEAAIDLLSRLAQALSHRSVDRPKDLTRLFIMGNCLEEISRVELMEDCGALVVADSICLGSRYYTTGVSRSGNLMDNLVRRYLKNISCPRMMDDYQGRMERIKHTVDQYRAEAIIMEKVEFCTMMTGESYICSHEMHKAAIPTITLTRELYGGGIGQSRTRIQAFLEKVKNRL